MEKANKTKAYWLIKLIEKRLTTSFYLNSFTNNFSINNNPNKMDKNVFSVQKYWSF